MFNSLFGQNNYRSYNIKLANKLGLEVAIYFELLLLMYNEVDEQEHGSFMVIDRKYIEECSTLDTKRQRELDLILKNVKLIDIENKDTIRINYSALISLFNDNNSVIDQLVTVEPVKKRTKSDIIKDELKSYIKTDNGELRDAYASWIDSVFAKQGWMSKKSVELGQKLIDEYSMRNLDVAIELLNIASIGGYRDIQWAINSYEENLKKKVSKIVVNPIQIPFEVKKKVELAQEVF